MSAARLSDPFAARDTFDTGSGEAGIYRLSRLDDAGLGRISALPFSIRLLLESLLRNCDGYEVTEDDVKNLASWNAAAPARSRYHSSRRASCCRTSPACRALSIWRRCGAPCSGWAGLQRRSTR